MSPADTLRLVAVLDTARALVSQCEAILGPEAETPDGATAAGTATLADMPAETPVSPLTERLSRPRFMQKLREITPGVVEPATPPVDPAA